jgi:hypothetical protein
MASLVPDLDNREVPIRAEDRDGPGRQIEQPARSSRQVEPSRGEDPEHVPVTEQQRVAGNVRCRAPRQDPIGPVADLIHRLAPGPWSVPDAPARVFAHDVHRRPTFERPVVPLPEVAVDDRDDAESGQPGGVHGPGERAGQDERELLAGEAPTESLRLGPTNIVERQIRPTRVAQLARPLGFAVTGKPDSSLGEAHAVAMVWRWR